MKKTNSAMKGTTIQLVENEQTAIELLSKTHDAMTRLAELRAQCKLSNSRVSGVARELNELMKVMAIYKSE